MRQKTTRRALLGTAAALAAGSAIAAPQAAKHEPKHAHDQSHGGDLKLAVATYSLRKFSRDQAIDIIKDLGVKYVNVKSFHLPYELTTNELKEAVQQFEKAGLEIVAAGNVGLGKDDEEFVRRHMEYIHNAGIPVMVCAPTHNNLGMIEKYAKKYNIKVAIHNHGPEDKFYPAPHDVLAKVKNMDPLMGLCVDVGHTARTGADVLEELKMAGDRLYDVHVKDLSDLMAKDSQVAVGDGKMPIPAIFKLLKDMNYQGAVGLEYEINAANPQMGMAKSFAYMRGVLDGQRS